MKHRTIILAACLLSLLLTTDSLAQGKVLTTYTYNVAFPTGSTQDFVDRTSFRGLSIGGHWFRNPNLALSFTAGWNVFNERTDRLINVSLSDLSEVNVDTDAEGAISGQQFRYINSFPFVVGVEYYFGQEDDIQPYLGLGAGVYYTIQRLDIGLVTLKEDEFRFGFSQEAGVLIPVRHGTSLVLGARYDYAFNSGNTLGGKFDVTYLSAKIGVAYDFSY